MALSINLEIRSLLATELSLFDAHFARHVDESGRDGFHFMPFSPKDNTSPNGLDPQGLALSLDSLGWERWFVAFDESQSKVVGHVDLKGDRLKTGLHRCELGIGIETPYRGRGLGKQLMGHAIEFCREAETLDWLDLKVFAHNKSAVALYRTLGFQEVGVLRDRFRIDGEWVDDIIMTLSVSKPSCRG